METNNQNPTTGMPAEAPAQKHMRTFWPVFIVVVVALIAGGVIMYFISDTETQEEINSVFFQTRRMPKVTPTPVIDQNMP